jgi:hypothetical protein
MLTHQKISVKGVTKGIQGFAEGKRTTPGPGKKPLLFVITARQLLNPGQPEMRQA